jgi:hypothetical protein
MMLLVQTSKFHTLTTFYSIYNDYVAIRTAANNI